MTIQLYSGPLKHLEVLCINPKQQVPLLVDGAVGIRPVPAP